MLQSSDHSMALLWTHSNRSTHIFLVFPALFLIFFWFNCTNQRLIETQNHSCWKRSLEAVLVKTLLRAGPIKPGCSGLFSAPIQMLQKFLRMEIPQPLWAIFLVLDCSHGNKLFLIPRGNFCFLTYLHCLLPYQSAPSIKDAASSHSTQFQANSTTISKSFYAELLFTHLASSLS